MINDDKEINKISDTLLNHSHYKKILKGKDYNKVVNLMSNVSIKDLKELVKYYSNYNKAQRSICLKFIFNNINTNRINEFDMSSKREGRLSAIDFSNIENKIDKFIENIETN